MGGIHTLSPRGELLDLGSYPTFIRNHDTDLSFEIDILIGGTRRDIKFGENQANISLKYSYDKRSEKIELSKLTYKPQFGWNIETRRNKDKTHRITWHRTDNKGKTLWTNPSIKSLTDFFSPDIGTAFQKSTGLSPFLTKRARGLRSSIREFLSELSAEFEELNYLGPFRHPPDRYYYAAGGARAGKIGLRGEFAIDYMNYEKISGNTLAIKFVEDWLKRLGYASKFDIKTIESFIKSTIITNKLTKVQSTLVDVGFGISQVLPVILSTYLHQYGVHIFEQPEIHLHPKSQGDLADLFVENLGSEKAFIIETHSEQLINRLRLRAVEDSKLRDKIVIYYFENKKSGFSARELSIKSNGSLYNMPNSFFDESLKETESIVKAWLKK